ncbi:hypothetical protein CXB51_001560 [Gossypium anomalum]|uniref:Aminotransferase-like plant mobile domain-containing protein n=1 Tax=Gossypium anomalum TaxID=47600 RepID=A0A8J6DC51_9ROSI|nr:hypothetical protein CXB51_001560 [Gossypium anomalum]
MPYLELAGFRSAALIRMFDLRYDLISALVKHWRLETHTFHLPYRECTVTLEDVALQLGLPIDRSAITGVSAIAEPTAFYYSLLGVLPAMLSPILRAWALYQMSFLASVRHQPYVFPLNRSYTIPIYHLMIEQLAGEGFIWMPYRRPAFAAVIPSSAYIYSHLWCINAPIINFQTVKWYNGDRRPQMDISSDLEPSLEYIQWYSSTGKPYLLGRQSPVVPPHMQRPRAYEPMADIEAEPEPEADLELELELEP